VAGVPGESARRDYDRDSFFWSMGSSTSQGLHSIVPEMVGTQAGPPVSGGDGHHVLDRRSPA